MPLTLAAFKLDFNMNKEEQFLLKHLSDLDQKAYIRNYCLTSDFLTLNEQELLLQHRDEFQCNLILDGGYENAERQLVIFQPDALSLCEDAYSYLSVQPLHKKYSECLTHRDVLGSLMNLGIERNILGDILVQNDEIILICMSHMVSFLQDEFHKIKHTEVMLQVIPKTEFTYIPNFENHFGTIASNRLDAFISEACNLSRQKSNQLILANQVFINGRACANFSQKLNPDDKISIRGFGKVIFRSILGESKKGKIRISYDWYR